MVRIGSDGEEIKEEEISEKVLQAHVENHSEKLLNCYLIKSKFNFEGIYGKVGGELDSLMIDKETLRPVIVEYKMGKLERNKTAINQIVYYYHWIYDHQSKINNQMLEEIKQIDLEFEDFRSDEDKFRINWDDDIRCIIIAKEFSDWDKVLLEHLDISIELYKYRYFDDKTFDLNLATDLQNSIKHEKRKKQEFPEVKKENRDNEKIIEDLYETSKFQTVREFIDKWKDSFELRGTVYYLAFKDLSENNTIIRIYFRKTKKLKITMIPIFSLKELQDKFPNLNIREIPYAHDLPITITDLTSEEDVNKFLNFISEGLENYI
jgi:hypothetical protein